MYYIFFHQNLELLWLDLARCCTSCIFSSPCTPLDSLFPAKDPAALRLIGVRSSRQWFIMPALLKCQKTLPLHACMCTCAQYHGGNKGAAGSRRPPQARQGAPPCGSLMCRMRGAGPFVPWRRQTGCMLGLICRSKSGAAREVRVEISEVQFCGFVGKIKVQS